MPQQPTERRQNPAPKAAESIAVGKTPSRLDQLEALLSRESGASIADMVATTSWQKHSVRGAMAGTLKKRGLIITSEKVEGTRRYHAEKPA